MTASASYPMLWIVATMEKREMRIGVILDRIDLGGITLPDVVPGRHGSAGS